MDRLKGVTMDDFKKNNTQPHDSSRDSEKPNHPHSPDSAYPEKGDLHNRNHDKKTSYPTNSKKHTKDGADSEDDLDEDEDDEDDFDDEDDDEDDFDDEDEEDEDE